jgi:chemotaxis protein methyltransferase CheR
MEEEIFHMIDAVTTNKTDFFREPNHFDYLVQQALPHLIKQQGAGVKRRLVAWSAGCSTGEEAYTIAMVLNEFGKQFPGLSFDFRILATDISTKVLETAKRAIYGEEKVDPIPMHFRKQYLLRSKDPSKGRVRIVPRLRQYVRFRRLNFLQDDFGFREGLDIIFFRNVLIYFKKSTQKQILRKVLRYLRPGGYLFIGHSETLLEMNLPLHAVAPTIYQRTP